MNKNDLNHIETAKLEYRPNLSVGDKLIYKKDRSDYVYDRK